MTPRQVAALRELRYRELLTERYGSLPDLEAERDGPTPRRLRRATRALQDAAEHQCKEAGV